VLVSDCLLDHAYYRDKKVVSVFVRFHCAASAGITALFNSPIADFFFVLEVISRKVTRALSLVISLQWQ
jgi:hypothetical protein